jgi:hypothetical protein
VLTTFIFNDFYANLYEIRGFEPELTEIK